MKYTVKFFDPSNGATSEIDTINAPFGYTADRYIRDCRENADPEWVEMLDDGTVELAPAETVTEKDAKDLLHAFLEAHPEYSCDLDICESDDGYQFLLETESGASRTLYVNHDSEDENTGIAHVWLGVETD